MVEEEKKIPLEYEYFSPPSTSIIRNRECKICGWWYDNYNNMTNHCVLHKLTDLVDILCDVIHGREVLHIKEKEY